MDKEGYPVSEDALHLRSRNEPWEAVGVTQMAPSSPVHAHIVTGLQAPGNAPRPGPWPPSRTFALQVTHTNARRHRKQYRVLRLAPEDVAVARRRIEQETPAFKERYKIRSGIEATNSELKRSHRLGKLRVRQRRRVGLSVRLKVLGLNIKRYVAHLVAVSGPQPEPLLSPC